MPAQVPGQVKKQRNHLLRALSDRKREAFAASQVGERLQVVLETRGATGEVYGLSDNYLEVAFEAPPSGCGLVVAEITSIAGSLLYGRNSASE